MVFLRAHPMRAVGAAIAFSMAIVFSAAIAGCGGFFYYPDHERYFDPVQNGYRPREVWFHAADGVKLHAWFFDATDKGADAHPTRAKPLGTLVQFHGNAENLTSHFASLVWITRRGYNLFVFDYRGYGRSEGAPGARGVHLDASAALDQAWSLHRASGATSFILYAQSLGGIFATRAFEDFPHRRETLALVLDSSFCSFKDMVQEKMASLWITWPFSPLGRLGVSDEYASCGSLQKIETPLLVAHDEKDAVVSVRNSEKIFQLSASPRKEFWRLAEGGHAGTFSSNHLERREAFLQYLKGLAP